MIFIHEEKSYKCVCKNKHIGYIENRIKKGEFLWFSNNYEVFLKVKMPIKVYQKILDDYKNDPEFSFELFREINEDSKLDNLSIFETDDRLYKIKSIIDRSTICSVFKNNIISVNFELSITFNKNCDKTEMRDFLLRNLIESEKQE